jgi:hypothetical protein
MWRQPPRLSRRAKRGGSSPEAHRARVDYPGNVGENDSSTSLDPDFVGLWLFVFNRGPVAQLGARFHGMEEVAGSIPARSTILSSTYGHPAFQFGSIW